MSRSPQFTFTARLMRVAAVSCFTALLAFSASTSGLLTGKPQLKSAGPLAFGPDGILFIGDSLGAAVVALDTRDNKPAAALPVKVDIKGIDRKVAAVLGTTPEQILIHDVKVNPISKNIYLSVSRGRGPQAIPVILRADAAGNMKEVPLDNVSFAAVMLPNPPVTNPGDPRDPRLDTITQLAFVNGSVIVAGLSNEEFSSNLRSIPFPFQSAGKGTSVEIYHGSHGRFETQAPVRTFVPYTIQNQQYLVAAYTCTPLVKIPVSELKPGSKLEGTTIAELGAGNRPLDMIAYRKNKHEFILMANSNRGVMKLSTDHLENYKPIRAPSEPAGVPYETLAGLANVRHLTSLDEANALVLIDSGSSAAGSMDLRSIPLP
jgi:hypothetical protein